MRRLTAAPIILCALVVLTATPCLAADPNAGEGKPPTVAVFPFANHGNRRHADLSAAISAVMSSTLQKYGAVLVNRSDVRRILDEKDLAKVGLSDKTELAKKGVSLGADYVITGGYTVEQGRLQITARVLDPQALVKHANEAYDRRFDKTKAEAAERVVIEGTARETIASVEELSIQLANAVGLEKPQEPGKIKPLDKNKAVAVFPFLVAPRTKDNAKLGSLLADLFETDLLNVLPAKVVSREAIERVMEEKKLAHAGMLDRSQAIKAARLVGADYLVIGVLMDYHGTSRLDVQALDVKTTAVLTSASATGTHEKLLANHRKLAADLAGKLGGAADRLERLRKRKVGTSSEAALMAYRAKYMLWHAGKAHEPEARSLMKMAMELDPESPWVLYYVSQCHRAMDNPELAGPLLKKALAQDPDHALANTQYSRYLRIVEDDPNAALPYALKGLKLGPPIDHTYAEPVRCLLKLGRPAEALPYARKGADTVHASYTYVSLGLVLDELGRYEEAAKWYFDGASRGNSYWQRYYRKAYKAYEKAGKTDKAMECLRILLSTGKGYYSERYRYAEYLSDFDKLLAAKNARTLLCGKNEYYATKARELLKKMGMPENRVTSFRPVFDVEKMRKKGRFILVQPFGRFQFAPGQKAYLQRHLEDVMGIPVRIDEETEPIPDQSVIRHMEHVRVDPHLNNRLIKKRKKSGAITAVGLLRRNIFAGGSGSYVCTRDTKLNVAFSSNAFCNRKLRDEEPWLSKGDPAAFGIFLRTTLKVSILTAMPDPKSRRYQCASRDCPLGQHTMIDQYYRPPYVCDGCRKMLRTFRKNYPACKEQPRAVDLGVRGPVFDKTDRHIAILPVGEKIDANAIGDLRELIELGLGMKTRLEKPVPMPDCEKITTTVIWDRAMPELAKRVNTIEGNPAAVLIYTGNKAWDNIRMTSWQAFVPGQDKAPKRLKYPVAAFSDTRLPYGCYDTITVERDGNNREYRRALHIALAGLYSVLQKQRPCYTYGCPTTLWYNLGVPERCGLTPCKHCRKAIRGESE